MSQRKENDELLKYIRLANESLFLCLDQEIHSQKYINSQSQTQQKEVKDKIIGEEELCKQMENISIFDKIEDFMLDESIEAKILNLKVTQFSQKRKQAFFQRFKKEQEQKIINYKRVCEKNYANQINTRLTKNEFFLRNEGLGKTQTFPITSDDMEKLRPQTDLNDTIIGNYIKLLQFAFLPPQTQQKCFIFSSFILEKLIVEYVKDQIVYDKDPDFLIMQVREKVLQNYKNVKRWTRKLDIFEKDILVFPINAFKHWFCMFVINPKYLLTPNTHLCEMIYCDSMMQKRQFVVQAIRKYLQCELEQKKYIKINLTEQNLPSYQLLLPRQTNTHDCGLYMITYIEELLLRKEQLNQLSNIKYRKKLNLFPRALIFTMRERLKRLFSKLINAKQQQQKSDILNDYKNDKVRIIKDAHNKDYDQIFDKEYHKYQKMNLNSVQAGSQQQRQYMCLLKFYLDPQINYYQKDKL